MQNNTCFYKIQKVVNQTIKMPLQLNKNYTTKIADSLFNESPISIFIINNDGIIKSANKSAIKLLNTSTNDIQFKSVFELFPNINLILTKAWCQNLYNLDSKELTTQFTNNKNDIVYIKISVQPNVEHDVHLVFVSVISESNYKENSMLKAEDKIAAFFDNSIDLISMISPQKTVLSFNKLFEHYIKEKFDLQIIEGDDFLDFVLPEYRDSFNQNFEKALNGEDVIFEKNYYFNELTIWWQVTYLPIRNSNGEILAVTIVLKNIDDKKQAESLLIKNQRKLQIAQNFAFLGNYEINLIEFKFEACQTTLDILGIDENFIKSSDDFMKLIHSEDVGKVKCFNSDNALNDIINTCEFRIINNKTSEIKWISAFSNVEFNENKVATRIIGAIQDITERKNIEFNIQKNETKYSNLIENMDLGILEVDNNEIIIKAYPKFCELVGYTESELIGKNTLEILLPVKKIDEFQSATEVRKKGISSAYELQITHKNGEPIDVLISGTPLFNENGKVYGSIGIHYNITDRKRIELELKKSFDLVTNQNKRLLNFSYIVSHNLRSHSSNISSLLNILNVTESDIEKAEIINHLNSVATLLNETLSNLNEVVSIQNNTDIIIEPIQVNEQINKVLILLKSQIDTYNIQIINEISDELFVNFNTSYFESIIYNLISNAIKYRKLNAESFVKISSFNVNNKIGLTIEDNGIGLDLIKNGEKLFGMYKTFNGNNDARGIGLFITKNQIETLGGNIEVMSELGIGTTFKIIFK